MVQNLPTHNKLFPINITIRGLCLSGIQNSNIYIRQTLSIEHNDTEGIREYGILCGYSFSDKDTVDHICVMHTFAILY